MKLLDHAVKHQIQAAEGWLGLGDINSASDELKQIAPAFREHPAVLVAQCKIHEAAKEWELMIPITETLVKQLPEFQTAWIHRSFALHELKRTREAYDLLRPALTKFSKLSIIAYNLSCYACQLGNHEEALMRLKQAIALEGENEDIRSQALADLDLKPLWKTIRKM